MTACFSCVSCLLGCFNSFCIGPASAVQGRTAAAGTTQTGFQGAQQTLNLLENATKLAKQVLESGNWKAAVGIMRSNTVGCVANCPKWLQCICNCCYGCATGNEEITPEDLANYLKLLEGQYEPIVLAAAYEALLESGELPSLMEQGFNELSKNLRKTCNQVMLQMKLTEFAYRVKASNVSSQAVDCVDGVPEEVCFSHCDYSALCKSIQLAKKMLN